MPNQLANETSPYLLQHAGNPVDWRPWGPAALQQARDEQKPIFLSIGYSACHWCHVMEHESFEDPQTAGFLNEHFVSIKVDREERPDLDQIYMNAVQLMTRHGGWPLSVFLTPDLHPFFGGTYWPPQPKYGRPSFYQVLQAVLDAWNNRRQQAIEQAAMLTEDLQRIGAASARGELQPELPRLARARLERSFDPVHGGFGEAPKFPHPLDVQLLLAQAQQNSSLLEIACVTLDKMARGGIYDHLGGGFARYSVDAQWLVPHFEKMLYDNALLAGAYLDAHLVTGRDDYRQVVVESVEYVLRDMTDPQGGFHSSEDADSEGEEGKFYVWSLDELSEALGAEVAERFAYVYDASESGNFEGSNILHLPRTIEQCAQLKQWDLAELQAELAAGRRQLMAIRERRVRPGKDDKILANWNALMIESMARAGAALGEPRYVEAAASAARFIQQQMRSEDGRLLHCWRLGKASESGFLDDYAGMAKALLALYESTWDEAWIDWAADLADQLLARFHDAEGGGFYFTADDHETLIARNKDLHDASVPSGNALAATALLRLGRLCGRRDWLDAAESTLQMAAEAMQKSPMTGQMFLALDLYFGPCREVIVTAAPDDPAAEELGRQLRRQFAPRRVTALRDGSAPTSKHLDAAFDGKPLGAELTTYVCENHACQAPVAGVEAALKALAE